MGDTTTIGKMSILGIIQRTTWDESREKGTKMSDHKKYTSPALMKWGTVADLTKTGTTTSGADAKGGSVASQGE